LRVKLQICVSFQTTAQVKHEVAVNATPLIQKLDKLPSLHGK